MSYVASRIQYMHMEDLNKAESPICVLLCVLCFQRQPFRLYWKRKNDCMLLLSMMENSTDKYIII